MASTELKIVQRKDDYRGVLKNSPRRKCSFYHFNTVTKYHHKHTNLVLQFTAHFKTKSRETRTRHNLNWFIENPCTYTYKTLLIYNNNKITQFTHTLIYKTMHNVNTDNDPFFLFYLLSHPHPPKKSYSQSIYFPASKCCHQQSDLLVLYKHMRCPNAAHRAFQIT